MNSSAEILSRNPALKKAFFDLGWDYFAARQGMPDDAQDYQCFVEGYEAARGRIHQSRGDRYELKLLQIRYGALKRNRIIDETLTAQLIHDIDVRKCPVTRQILTHSSFSETDWSVDRVRNDAGYIAGNLVVVSTKANRAKGTLSYDDIEAIVESGESYNGLNAIEWARWRLICSLNVSRVVDGKALVGYVCAPYVVKCPNMMIMNASTALQHAIARKAYGMRSCNMLTQLMNGLPKSLRKDLNGILSDARQYINIVREDECEIWHVTKLFNRFRKLYMSLDTDTKRIIVENFYKDLSVSGTPINPDTPAWDPAFKGYNN